MQKHMSSSKVINVVLLFSSLALLSGCSMDWFKNKMGCQSCEHSSEKSVSSSTVPDNSQVLLKIGDKNITAGDYQAYWDEFLSLDPNAAAMLPFMPNARYEVFKNYLIESLIAHWMKQNGKDKDESFRKKLEAQRKLAERALVLQGFQEYVLEKIDKSDEAAQEFYRENREKNPIFQQPPFIKVAGGVKAQAVQFSDEKSAAEFLDKAKKGGSFSGLAKEMKKTANDFGNEPINAQTRNVDSAVKAKLSEMTKFPSIEMVQSGKNYWVVRGISKTEASYASFDEVKDAVKQVMLQTKFPEVFTAEIEKLKAEYGIDEASAKEYFEEERKKQEAELQEQIKAAQERQVQEAQGQDEQPAEMHLPESATKAA